MCPDDDSDEDSDGEGPNLPPLSELGAIELRLSSHLLYSTCKILFHTSF